MESMTPQLAPKERCTGCGACANGCPKNAIHMLPDREGFLCPTVTDACVQCGHCTHICPVLKHREGRPDPAVFAVWNTDKEIRLTSDAGGVFPLLADYILESGGVVFGAALDDSLHVRHVGIRSRDELPAVQGIKPVQSEVRDAYQRVRHHLELGRKVLFSGTPCQVDGLYRFLGEHPENLLTVDILCQGVSSPGVWDHLVRSMAYVKRKRPVAVSFFAKLPGSRDRRFRVRFDDDSTFDAPFSKCEFGRGHSRGLFLRAACHTCPYSSTDRPGDLSLGEYAGLPKDFYPEEQKDGISLLLVNTPKGAHVFDTLPVKKELRTLSEAVESNPSLRQPRPSPAERSAFFSAYAQQPFQQVRTRFLSPMPYQSARRPRALLQKLIHRRRGKEDA